MPSFPKDFVVSEMSRAALGARWLARLRRHQGAGAGSKSAPAPNGEPQANVDVWHWKDAEVQSVQVVRLAQERRATLPAVFNLASDKLVRIADDVMRNVTPTPDPKWAIGRVDTTYRTEVQWGGVEVGLLSREHRDGDRTLIEKGVSRTMGSSPDGKWFLYLKDKKVVAYNAETGKIDRARRRRQDQLRRRDGRPSVRDAGVRRRGLVEGRQVGDSQSPVRSLQRAARRRQGRRISRAAWVRRSRFGSVSCGSIAPAAVDAAVVAAAVVASARRAPRTTRASISPSR